MNTPVALMVFSRPETTRLVFEQIARARPRTLFVVADGPRPNREGEAERCAAVRDLIERVDWRCDLYKEYSGVNLGCRRRMSSGLSWVFSAVEEAIVLEDDCVPEPGFFRYCEELLARYREDRRVLMMSGFNFEGTTTCASSYFISRYPHVWGWASWRRVWQQYDVDMRDWPSWRRSVEFRAAFDTRNEREFWRRTFDRVYSGEIDTWDVQLTYLAFRTGAVSVFPRASLISNVGIGADATHTKQTPEFGVMAERTELGTIAHPAALRTNDAWDRKRQRAEYSTRGYLRRAASLLQRNFGAAISRCVGRRRRSERLIGSADE
jgi:hypothetical protein